MPVAERIFVSAQWFQYANSSAGEIMTRIDGSWSHSELESFLRDSLVPIRLACHHTDGGLWMVSLWYQYEGGQLLCATGRNSNIASFLRRNDEVSFEVSTNRPPYMGVRGKGTTTLEADEDKALLKTLMNRYLGGTDSDLAAMLLDDKREELVIRIDPERLFTWDFTERMQSVRSDAPALTSTEPESPRDGKTGE